MPCLPQGRHRGGIDEPPSKCDCVANLSRELWRLSVGKEYDRAELTATDINKYAEAMDRIFNPKAMTNLSKPKNSETPILRPDVSGLSMMTGISYHSQKLTSFFAQKYCPCFGSGTPLTQDGWPKPPLWASAKYAILWTRSQ